MEKINRATIVCNHADYTGECTARLNLVGKDRMNVYPRVKFFKEYFGEMNPRLVDFIEIATFIYVADQMLVRCQGRVDPHGFLWRREINMIIAVQDYEFWNSQQVVNTLERLLRFLSDDNFRIQFSPMREVHPDQGYFDFSDNMGNSKPLERVMLFSGGLDSLGGAIQELICNDKRTVLVRHKSSTKHKERYQFIETALQKLIGNKVTFFTINTGKDGALSKEYTQRCRSFLYFSLAGTIAALLKLEEICFYENGPISLNLPMSPQVVGGRATRTTHPQTLFFFQELMRLISGDPNFRVRNPFIDKTKSEIVKLIIENGCSDLISKSMSCAHSWQQTKLQTHCGICSQCVDRRVAIIAANAQQYDCESEYAVDFFTEAVDKKVDDFDSPNKNLITSYFLRGKRIAGEKYTYEDFETDYPSLSDATLYMGKEPDIAAYDIFKLYRRLALDILAVERYARAPKYIAMMSDLDNPLSPDSLSGILLRGTRTVTEQIQYVPERLPDFLFRKKGAMWQLRFNGGPENLLGVFDGCEYIAKLLATPDVAFSLDQLAPSEQMSEACVDGDEIMDGFSVGENYAPAIDPKAKANYYKEVLRLKAEKEKAEAENNTVEAGSIQEDIESILKELQTKLKPGGKARNVNRGIKRQSDRIRRAINTVIEKINVFDQDLAEHLKTHIKIGEAPIYNPDSPIKWTTT